MGTVPYLKDESLIDANFRLKEYKNIYVVGSSAFPTSGFENPTHNSMAIALAASDHIMSIIEQEKDG